LLWCADYLATAYDDLFPTQEIDPNHFAVLMRRGHDPLDIEAIILNFLPVTNFPGLESSADFLLAYKELARQHALYKERGIETATESRMAAWIEKNRAARKHAARFEKLEGAFNRDDTPIDPGDAAEEEAWLAADQAIDDGEAAELDPMQDAFDGEREDAEFEDGMHDAFIELPLAPRPAAEVALWKVLAGDEIAPDVWEQLARENPKVSGTEMARYRWGVFLGGTRWKFFQAEKDAAEFVSDNSPATAGHAIKVRKLVGA